MKDARFDALIVAARPKDYKIRAGFTDAVMSHIQSPEILSSRVRNMDVNKKETFMTRLKHLPKLAIVAIAVGAVLALSAGAYATYQLLWPKPTVEVSEPQTSVSGREEVVVSLAQCGDERIGERYELKRNATITADQVAGVVKAQCELGAIRTWAYETFPNDRMDRSAQPGVAYQKTDLSVSMATRVKSIQEGTMTFVGLTKYMQEDKSFAVTDKTRFIADGIEVTANDIKTDDSVVFISSQIVQMTPREGSTAQSYGFSGALVSEELVAVVKLSLPLENYDQFAWQSLAERMTCMGNPNDTCLTGYISGVDLYMANHVPTDGYEMKEIQGVITEYNGSTVIIKSSSGTLFTIETPGDIIAGFNLYRSSSYNNQQVKVGSSLMISYIESKNAHSKVLSTDMLHSVMFHTEIIGKSDPLNAY